MNTGPDAITPDLSWFADAPPCPAAESDRSAHLVARSREGCHEAYAELIDQQQRPLAGGPSGHDARQATAHAEDDEEALLARWYELDALLAADLARKPRHQTPRLQQEWRHELARLASMLGLVES